MSTRPYLIAELHERLLATEAVNLWNAESGPVFWYAANVPGPFYVNTEKLIGGAAAEKLLKALSQIVETTAPLSEKAGLITDAVLAEYRSNPEYQRLVANVQAVVAEQDTSGKSVISGGERRDWFFSIPVAFESKRPHLFIFKDGGVYVDGISPEAQGQIKEVVHVADLINNAASYIDRWIPFLQDRGIAIRSTVAVVSRGRAGMETLDQHGVLARAVLTVDEAFFEDLCEQRLITREQLQELKLYYVSPPAWAQRYIASNPKVLETTKGDSKSRVRFEAFVRDDPWGLGLG